MAVPVIVVVDGVVDTLTVFYGIVQIQSRNCEMIKKRGVVCARTQGIEAQIWTTPKLGAIFRRLGDKNLVRLTAFPDRHLGFGIFNVASDAVGELLEGM